MRGCNCNYLKVITTLKLSFKERMLITLFHKARVITRDSGRTCAWWLYHSKRQATSDNVTKRCLVKVFPEGIT